MELGKKWVYSITKNENLEDLEVDLLLTYNGEGEAFKKFCEDNFAPAAEE